MSGDRCQVARPRLSETLSLAKLVCSNVADDVQGGLQRLVLALEDLATEESVALDLGCWSTVHPISEKT